MINNHLSTKISQYHSKGDENKKNLPIEFIGFIAGVITLNDKVEVMIKFPKELVQLTKSRFTKQMTLLAMP